MEDPIAAAEALVVTQKRELLEIFTELEGKNNYEIRDDHGRAVLYAGEANRGVLAFILRSWLKAARPFTLAVANPAGERYLTVRRPWRFYFYRLEVSDGAGAPLGVVRRRFKILGRRYTIDGADGQSIAELHGPLIRPWTFKLIVGDREVGAIRKRWSGILKEAFTDADNFGVEFADATLPVVLRRLVLAATFLIDFVHFEARTTRRD
ncbi:MAG: hypothetical protein KC466_13200 [Myxococcales bacterium]|nr:hypothetical protein [Myxococcales bacterium]